MRLVSSRLAGPLATLSASPQKASQSQSGRVIIIISICRFIKLPIAAAAKQLAASLGPPLMIIMIDFLPSANLPPLLLACTGWPKWIQFNVAPLAHNGPVCLSLLLVALVGPPKAHSNRLGEPLALGGVPAPRWACLWAGPPRLALLWGFGLNPFWRNGPHHWGPIVGREGRR